MLQEPLNGLSVEVSWLERLTHRPCLADLGKEVSLVGQLPTNHTVLHPHGQNIVTCLTEGRRY
jgi:hypothetical protein